MAWIKKKENKVLNKSERLAIVKNNYMKWLVVRKPMTL